MALRVTLFCNPDRTEQEVREALEFYRKIAIDAGAIKISESDAGIEMTFPDSTTATSAMITTASHDARIQRIKGRRLDD